MIRIHLAVLFAAALFASAPARADTPDHGMMSSGDGMHGRMQEHGMMDEGSGTGGYGACGEDMHMPMMGGKGEGMMHQFASLWKLGLNQDQRSRLNRLQYDLRRQHLNLKGKILDEQAKLYDLYAADKPDPKRIGAVYGAIFDVRRQMIETTIEAMNRGRDILTKEQQARLKQLQQGGTCGTGGHHEMMHRAMSGSTGTK